MGGLKHGSNKYNFNNINIFDNLWNFNVRISFEICIRKNEG